MVESIYSSTTRTEQYWANVFEQMEIIASPEQIFRPMLAYAKQTILPKSNNRISTVAKHIADLLFGNPSSIIKQEREERIHKFLNIAIFRLVKSKWADDKLARLVISIAILAKGGAEQDEMTASAQSMIVNSVKRAIQTWSDPVFIKHGSSGEKYCKFYVIPDEDYIRTEKKKKIYRYDGHHIDIDCIYERPRYSDINHDGNQLIK